MKNVRRVVRDVKSSKGVGLAQQMHYEKSQKLCNNEKVWQHYVFSDWLVLVTNTIE